MKILKLNDFVDEHVTPSFSIKISNFLFSSIKILVQQKLDYYISFISLNRC